MVEFPNNRAVAKELDSKAQFRLFCFPYAGGGPSIFRFWQEVLPDEVEVIPVLLPGRGPRYQEVYDGDWRNFIDSLGHDLFPCLDRPFAFFGHSMGALLAYELTRSLRRSRDILPEQLYVSGCGAPPTLKQDKENPLHKLPDQKLIEEIQKYDGIPSEVLQYEELIQAFLPILRSDLRLFESYEFKQEPPLGCSIIAFGGLQDGEVSEEALESWKEQTTGYFSSNFFPGGHFFINSERESVVSRISQEMGKRFRFFSEGM